MSQDNLVTPRPAVTELQSDWLCRSLSLAGVPLMRLRHIERMYGSVRRMSDACGCQKESRYPSPAERASLWGALRSVDGARQVLLSTPCQMLPVVWLVLNSEGGAFSWGEVWELKNPARLFRAEGVDLLNTERTLEEWEIFGKTEFRFRVVKDARSSLERMVSSAREALLVELLQRNSKHSHLNISIEADIHHPAAESQQSLPESREFEVEFLRDRLIPDWRQSGDMAFKRFKTYTVTRKDI